MTDPKREKEMAWAMQVLDEPSDVVESIVKTNLWDAVFLASKYLTEEETAAHFESAILNAFG